LFAKAGGTCRRFPVAIAMNGKRRVRELVTLNGNVIYRLQVYEHNCFKRWLTVSCTIDKEAAAKWVA
jgi:hypothetical protein